MLLWISFRQGGIPLAVLSLVLVISQGTAKENITLGILVPWFDSSWDEGPRAIGAALIAIDEINNNNNLLRDYRINYMWRDDGCNRKDSLGNITEMWAEGVDAFIGPACSESCEPTGELAAVWNLPMISWSCTSPALSDKEVYPTFVRTAGPYKTLGKPFAELMKNYKWYRCAILSANQNLYSQSARHIQSVLEQEYASDNPEECKPSNDCQIQVKFYKQFYAGTNAGAEDAVRREREELLTELKSKARVIFILGYTDDVRDFMLRAKEMDMLEGYVWIGVDILGHEALGWMSQDTSRNELARQAFQGLISYTVAVPSSNTYQKFVEEAINKTIEEFNFNPGKKLSSYAQNLYDAVYLYAYSVEKLKALYPGEPIKNGRKLAQLMMNTTITSLGRKVVINAEGDRESDYQLQSYLGNGFKDIGSYTSATGKLVLAGSGWVWPGNLPIDKVPLSCGSDGSICLDDEHNSPDKIVIAVVAVLLVVVIIAIVIFIWRRHEQAERDKKLWIIPRGDIRIVGGKYRSSVSINEDGDSHRSYSSIYSNGDIPQSTGGNDKAIYKGQVVGIQKVHKTSITVNANIIKEFKTVRELSHENINPVYGACPEPNNIMIVSGLMGKGTLQDILSDERITLDEMFKSSMIGDAAKALEYLHKSVLQNHGNLTSNALGVDSHWVLKLSDYGLHEFRSGAEIQDQSEDHQYTALYWRAPELLKDDRGTQKGDIYAFGIIINEILTRRIPYETCTESPKEVIEKIEMKFEPPFRPLMDQSGSYEIRKLEDLVVKMWANEVHERPDNMSIIRRQLKDIFPEKSRSITERVIMMMEKYAANLEQKVEERTAELREEKKKADHLLYRMLPKQVAEILKQGSEVDAQQFENVTVYFSDVVSFTNLCAASTPMQVVKFLDDMYTLFDTIIEKFDVYKVETIGDAYMLVSGLPERNGDAHVIEITETALALIEGVRTFKVRHKPGYQLQIRVGIHSGPCCAGVVGKTMPRYCLFGDTINTASRMESNGQAMRVHMSETTHALLEPLGYYKLIERGGTIPVKGKGDMKTYFCDGHDGTKRPKLIKSDSQESATSTPARSPSPPAKASRQPPKGYRSINKRPESGNNNKPPNNSDANGHVDIVKELSALQDTAI